MLDDWETTKSYRILYILAIVSGASVVILLIVLEYFLRQQGTNKRLKWKMQRRYGLSSFAFIAMQAMMAPRWHYLKDGGNLRDFTCIKSPGAVFEDCDQLHDVMIYTYWSACTCILVVVARMSEPMIRRAFADFFCCRNGRKKYVRRSAKPRESLGWQTRKFQDTMNTFLGSSAKTEYVYVILESVCRVLKEREFNAEMSPA